MKYRWLAFPIMPYASVNHGGFLTQLDAGRRRHAAQPQSPANDMIPTGSGPRWTGPWAHILLTGEYLWPKGAEPV